jgi:endogenous inhibitor of DNA gyrase (YacG/DUF329 family)
VDLSRWLRGTYAITGKDEDDDCGDAPQPQSKGD